MRGRVQVAQGWPYSQYSEANGLVTLSGQTAMNKGVLVSGGIEEQTRQAISNCMAIMRKLVLDKSHILDVQVVLLDIDRDREGFEEVYDKEFFPDVDNRPSRTLFGGKPANGSLIDIKIILSRPVSHRGPEGEPDTDDTGQIR